MGGEDRRAGFGGPVAKHLFSDTSTKTCPTDLGREYWVYLHVD